MTRIRTIRLVLGLALALAATACGGGETVPKASTAAGPGVSVLEPADGTTQKGNVVTLVLRANGAQVVKADGDTSNKTGHYHVFIDRDPVAAGAVIPKEKGIVHSADFRVVIPGLSAGVHTFSVVLGNGAHERFGDATVVNVTLGGPSLDASAPATVKVGQAITLTTKVDGVVIVKADGDASGRSGHFHIFIDRAPALAGEVIPKETGIVHTTETTHSLAPLAKGEHTIWIVLGDGAHKAFNPLVADKVVVTVE